MENRKTTKNSCSGEDVLTTLIKLYEHQEQIKITCKVEKNKEAQYEEIKLEKVL